MPAACNQLQSWAHIIPNDRGANTLMPNDKYHPNVLFLFTFALSIVQQVQVSHIVIISHRYHQAL